MQKLDQAVLKTSEFLYLLFGNFFQSNKGYIEIRSIYSNRRTTQEFYSNIESMPLNHLLTSRLSDKRNIFFGVAPRKQRGGKEQDVAYVNSLWSDLDTPEAQEKIKIFHLKPSVIIDSGHGLHTYWFLKEPVHATQEFKDILRGLQKAIGADHTHDLSRIMRLPGTWNLKDPNNPVRCKILEINDTRYNLEDFYQYKTSEEPSEGVHLVSKAFNIVPVNLEKFNLSQRSLTVIKEGKDDSFPSRSEADFFAVNSLVEAGARDDEIYSVFNNPTYKISEKYLEKDKYGLDYLNRTISKARAKHTTNIVAEINAIRILDKAPPFEKKQKIAALVINHLTKWGRFYRTYTAYYFFNNKTKQLLNIDSDEFNALLTRCSSLNPTEIEFRYVKESIKAIIVSDSPLIEAHRFAYFEKGNGCLYVYNNAQQIYKLDGHTIELVDNGMDDILFLDDPYADTITISQGSGNEKLVENLLVNRINFSQGNGISLNPYEQRLLLRVCIYGGFFKSIMQGRPILAFIGPKGSGKSHICRSIGKILIGTKFNVSSMTTEEGYYTAVTNNTLAAFDNVDGSIKWLNDALAITATGGFVEKRELYTTNRNVRFNLDSLIMINSRTPQFKRDDVADRLIIFKLERFTHFKNEEHLIRELLDSRNQIWGELLENLNKIVKILRENQNPLPTAFRMAAWAEVAWKIAECFKKGEEFLHILNKMSLTQSHFTLEDDLLWIGLQEWLQKPQNRGREVTTGELYKELEEIMGEQKWQSHYKSPIALGKRLKNVISNLRDFIEVETRKGHRSQNYYTFNARSKGLGGDGGDGGDPVLATSSTIT